MLDDRKLAILRAVVETYIETAEPVGSALAGEAADLGVSSATIRNELSQLDQQGYLTQPHTSAGRIPTDKAYRAFVDDLDRSKLAVPDDQRVRDFFEEKHTEIEGMLERTTSLLSELTGVAAVVVSPDKDQATVRSVQLVELAPMVVLAVMVLSDGTVEKATIELVDEVDDVTIAMASGHLSAAMVGRSIDHAAAPTSTGNATADRMVESARAVLTTSDVVGDLYVGGLSSIPGSFEAIETVREVMGLLEEQLVVVSLVRDVIDRGMAEAIGEETGVDPLAECSLVVAPYNAEGGTSGTIGVLGPTRVNYPHALAAVAVVSQSLERRLGEG